MGYKFNPFTGNLDNTGLEVTALNTLGVKADLATIQAIVGPSVGDVWQADDTDIFYLWDGSAWVSLGTLGTAGPTGPAGVGVVAGGTTGQALVKASNTDYDTQWADVTAVAAIDDLTDVVITTPSDGQVLEYDSATSQWINATPTGGGGGTPGGSDTQIQFNDAGSFGGDVDLTWNKTTNVMTVGGDIDLDDGGTYTTTLQTITPTANRTVSIPDATGTVALVAGSSGQLVYNSAGAYAGASGSSVGASGDITLSANGAASTGTGSAFKLTGSWYTGANPVPQALIQPAGTATSTTWSTSGTGLGVNAASGFSGNLLDLQVDGTNILSIAPNSTNGVRLYAPTGFGQGYSFHLGGGFRYAFSNSALRLSTTSSTILFGIGETDVASFARTGLSSPSAGVLEQINATNAQTYRLYNTYTNASDYQRTSFTDGADGLVIDQQYAGTGAARTNLLDLKNNGTSKFNVKPDGSANGIGWGIKTSAGLLQLNNGAGTIFAYLGTSSTQLNQQTLFLNTSSTEHVWTSGGTRALVYSPSSNLFEVRNSTNAQTYRLYNTYTDASNYERAKLAWNSNVFEIGTEGAGTGSEQPVRITAATLKLPNLPTYADNTAATSGGLVAGDVYKTATGELRITV